MAVPVFVNQPVDVGVNKQFKDRICYQWELWMIAEGLIHGSTSSPSKGRHLQTDIGSLPISTRATDIKLMGGYMHGDYCWFPADNAAHEEPQYSIKW